MPPPPPGAGSSLPLLLRCEDVKPHLGPMRVAMVASAVAHGCRLAGGRCADLRDPAHGGGTASDARPGRGLGLASLLGGALEILGRGHLGWTGRVGGNRGTPRHPSHATSPPKGGPRTEADALAQTLWHSTRWCCVLVCLGWGADSLYAHVAYGVSAQRALNRTFWDHATQYVACHATAP